jgi:hypothetical protein
VLGYRPCFAAVGCVVACFFCAKKKRQKKRRVGLAAFLLVDKRAYASASGQTYVRQALAPTLHPVGLVAVTVLADTMFYYLPLVRCFSNSMIRDLPQFPGVVCPAPCNRCTAVGVLWFVVIPTSVRLV